MKPDKQGEIIRWQPEMLQKRLPILSHHDISFASQAEWSRRLREDLFPKTIRGKVRRWWRHWRPKLRDLVRMVWRDGWGGVGYWWRMRNYGPGPLERSLHTWLDGKELRVGFGVTYGKPHERA